MRRIISTIILTGALLFAAIPVASAADELALSEDGVTWSDSLNNPLFGTPNRWVPGDDETRSFWIRNTSNDAASLTVEAVGLEESLFARGDVSVRIRNGSGPWTSLDADSATVRDTLQAGEAREFRVNVRFASGSDNATQVRTFPLAFNLQLSGGAEGEVAPPGDDDTPDDSTADGEHLPESGLAIRTPVLLVSILAIVLGAHLLLRARRRNLEEDA